MDPNQALQNLRNAMRAWSNAGTNYEERRAAQDIVEAAEALDDLLSNGGPLPDEWLRQKTLTRTEIVTGTGFEADAKFRTT